MKIQPLKTGTAVTRQYNNAKKIALSTGVGSGVALSSFAHALSNKSPLEGGIALSGFTLLADSFADSIKHIKKLRPSYNAIVKRAKNIYNK